jgi:hypothetical protein
VNTNQWTLKLSLKRFNKEKDRVENSEREQEFMPNKTLGLTSQVTLAKP